MKTTYKILSSCFLALSLLISACSSTPKYTITVNNGTGGGSYEVGKTATITATIPEYKEFDYWKLNDMIVSNSNPYTFTVVQDATYTAFFKTQQATVTVVNGSGGGTFDKGTSATITATVPSDKVFDYWSANGSKASTNNPYTFTVTDDVTYTAVFKNETVDINVVNGSGSGTYDKGTSVTITADQAPEYQIFDHWDLSGENISSNNPYTFNAVENATYTAIYKDQEPTRGVKRTDTTPIRIIPIDVSKGGTITVDYRFVNPLVDKSNSVSILLGSDVTNCYGKYEIFSEHLSQSYDGITFIPLDDGYSRLIIVVSKLNQIQSGSKAPTTISNILFADFGLTKGVYFDVKSETVLDTPRGTLYSNAQSPIALSDSYTVSNGGTLVVDYKYVDPITDEENGVSLFFGSDSSNCFGKYKIFHNKMEKNSYDGATFTPLDDGYYRITLNISKLNELRADCTAPTIISKILFRWFESTKGVYFEVNPEEKVIKTTEFKMNGSDFVIANFTDIHVDKKSLLSDDGTTGKTIKYGITKSNPDILTFSGDIAGSSSDLDYILPYLDSFKIPYFFILGNHDHEGSLGYDTIAQKVNKSKYGYIEKGPDALGSQGNYTIKIKNSVGDLVHGLVMMDTGNKYTITDDSNVEYVNHTLIDGVKYGTYNNKRTYCDGATGGKVWDGIHGNQITWYGNTVDALNCQTTLICHAPFNEYVKAFEQYQDAVNKKDQAAINTCAPVGKCIMGEQSCGSVEKLGLFDKIIEKNSTKNVICGHDHANAFSLLYQGVRLTYSVKTGEGSYWKTDGSVCGYTELKINSSGQTSLDQVYYNPLS